MKLSKREKILVVLLGVLALGGIYYQYVLTPQLNTIKNLEQELNTKKAMADRVKIDIRPESKIHENYKVLNSKIALTTKNMFPAIIQEKIILTLDNMIKNSNVEVTNLTFNTTSIEEIKSNKETEKKEEYPIKKLVNDFNKYKQEAKAPDEKKENKSKIEKMTVNLSYEGQYVNVMKFINSLKNYDKNIVITSVNLAADENNLIAGSMSLDLYAIPRLIEDEEYLKWEIETIYGKDNIFSAFSGYSDKQEKSTEKIQVNSDFSIAIKPITSDLPTIVFGKTSDFKGDTYIYADNEEFENVEFEIFKENKNYYVRYKTEHDSYPANYEKDRIKLHSKGKDINFEIFSYRRFAPEDRSGANLTLINATDLNLNVLIKNDDENRSRVNILKTAGNVFIKR